MDRLMIGVSGLRGIVGSALTPDIVTHWAMAFGSYLQGGRVVVGRDTRPSGEMIKHAVLAGLMAEGCSVIDVGTGATPSCSLMVRELKADGGIMITGSHNPAEWNALKFFRADGIDLNEAEGADLRAIHDEEQFRHVPWHSLVAGRTDATASERHVRAILENVSVEAIRAAGLRVVLDACNGGGAVATPGLLRELGCEMIGINVEPNGDFVRDPEPIEKNLGALCDAVRDHGAAIGFAQDADADRIALVAEGGRFLGEELSLALVARHLLAKTPGAVAINISSSRMVDDVAARFDSKVVRTKVGEVNVAEAVIEHRAVVGGEGNGGIIDPTICPIRDSLAGIARILEYLAETGRPISELAAELDRYCIRKIKLECTADQARAVLERAQEVYADQQVNTLDGVRIDWPDRWVQVRPSGTEPIIRIIAEARTASEADRLCDEMADLARPLIAAADATA